MSSGERSRPAAMDRQPPGGPGPCTASTSRAAAPTGGRPKTSSGDLHVAAMIARPRPLTVDVGSLLSGATVSQTIVWGTNDADTTVWATVVRRSCGERTMARRSSGARVVRRSCGERATATRSSGEPKAATIRVASRFCGATPVRAETRGFPLMSSGPDVFEERSPMDAQDSHQKGRRLRRRPLATRAWLAGTSSVCALLRRGRHRRRRLHGRAHHGRCTIRGRRCSESSSSRHASRLRGRSTCLDH